MKYFLRKVCSYLGILTFLLLLMFLLASSILKKNKPNHTTAAVIDKYNAIKKKGKERIILMGGSNVLYSINSSFLERSLKKEVLNSSLVFNSGYEYQLNFIKKLSRKGDVVLYFPEFLCYSGSGRFGNNFLYECILYEKRLLGIVGFENIRRYLINSTNFNLKTIFNNFKKNKENNEVSLKSNRVNGFNKQGDFIGHLNEKPILSNIRSYPIVESLLVSQDYIDLLKNVRSDLEEKGVKFYVMFPVYSENFVSKKLIKEIDSLAKKYDFFIGNLKEILFEDDMFYDSPYHALSEARDLRTIKIIENLKQK